MPFYEFKCSQCEERTEIFCSMQEKQAKLEAVVCKCGGKVDPQNEVFGAANYAFAQPIGTDRWTSDQSGHDYRYKFNQPYVQLERDIAAQSHMGATPYGCLDVPIG